jgi:hypothetical protein
MKYIYFILLLFYSQYIVAENKIVVNNIKLKNVDERIEINIDLIPTIEIYKWENKILYINFPINRNISNHEFNDIGIEFVLDF